MGCPSPLLLSLDHIRLVKLVEGLFSQLILRRQENKKENNKKLKFIEKKFENTSHLL